MRRMITALFALVVLASGLLLYQSRLTARGQQALYQAAANKANELTDQMAFSAVLTVESTCPGEDEPQLTMLPVADPWEITAEALSDAVPKGCMIQAAYLSNGQVKLPVAEMKDVPIEGEGFKDGRAEIAFVYDELDVTAVVDAEASVGLLKRPVNARATSRFSGQAMYELAVDNLLAAEVEAAPVIAEEAADVPPIAEVVVVEEEEQEAAQTEVAEPADTTSEPAAASDSAPAPSEPDASTGGDEPAGTPEQTASPEPESRETNTSVSAAPAPPVITHESLWNEEAFKRFGHGEGVKGTTMSELEKQIQESDRAWREYALQVCEQYGYEDCDL